MKRNKRRTLDRRMAQSLSEADLAQVIGGVRAAQEPDWVTTYSNIGGAGQEEDD